MKITTPVPESSCIQCGVKVSFSQEVKAEGEIFWGKIQCQACSTTFEQAWPIAHLSRFSLRRKNNQYHFDNAISWIAQSRQSGKVEKAEYHSEKRQSLNRVKVFNCLDACYGHAVLKLFQIFPWLGQSEFQVVVLVPEVIRWMVPKEVAGIISVQSPLSSLNFHLEGFDLFCDDYFAECSHIELNALPLNFDYEKLSVSKFIGEISSNPSENTRVCIVWRDDRFWMRSAIGEKLAFVYYKFRWNWLRNFLRQAQARSFKKFVASLKSENPSLQVTVVGMSSQSPVLSWAEDCRVSRPNEEDEKKWCQVYANSDLVIGVHGSHMLLPSLLAGGMINLMPPWKIMHQGEDVLFLKSDLERRTKLRFVPTNSSIKALVEHANSILAWWKNWYS